MPELTMQIFLDARRRSAEINNGLCLVPLIDFTESPLFAELVPELATQWATYLRLLADRCDEWATQRTVSNA